MIGCTTATCQGALPQKAKLALKRTLDPAKDRLTWTWKSSGTVSLSSFGDPTTTSAYTLCVIDQEGGQPTVQLDATAPAGDLCAGVACWKAKPTGFQYKDKDLTPDGLAKIGLKAGDPGKAKLKASGKGANLALPTLPLTAPVTVRLLRKDAPVCWEATYSSPTKNDAASFKAKSD